MKIDDLKIENKEEFRIRKLQYDYKIGQVYEEDISDNDKNKLIDLYKKQNLEIKEKLKIEREEIKQFLKKLKL